MLDLSNVRYVPYNERIKDTIETGFIDLDMLIDDLKPGEITIVFGRNGEGKSTVASQMIGHHLSTGRKVYLYSGELSENKIQEWLYKQIVGSDYTYYNSIKGKYKTRYEIKPQVIKLIKAWHKERLYIYNMKLDKIRKDTKRLFEDMLNAKKKGVELFVIDNLMTAYEINERTQYSDQSNFVQACKSFAADNNVHVLLVAHPNKAKEELKADIDLTKCPSRGNLEKNDVSGSGNISNKADNVISVERVWKTKGVEYDQSVPDCFITSLKDRDDGSRAVFKYWFSKRGLRFYNTVTPSAVNYDWRNEGKQEVWVQSDDAPF